MPGQLAHIPSGFVSWYPFILLTKSRQLHPLPKTPTAMNRASRLREAQRIGPGPDPVRQAAMQVPFLDDTRMSGPPFCTAENFALPRLRQCTFDPSTIVWEDKLGGGLDGYVWKVCFGEIGPFVLKVVSAVYNPTQRAELYFLRPTSLFFIISSGTPIRPTSITTMPPSGNARTLPSCR